MHLNHHPAKTKTRRMDRKQTDIWKDRGLTSSNFESSIKSKEKILS